MCKKYHLVRFCPQLIESASIDENDIIYSTVVNIADKKSAKIKCQIADRKVKNIKAYVLNGDIHDKNDFDCRGAIPWKYKVSNFAEWMDENHTFGYQAINREK